MKKPSSFDVAVVGAGPAGCAVAAGFAKHGKQVLLLEANPKAAARFAGEWIHPPGLRVLDGLGLTPIGAALRHDACHGFAFFPDDGSDPIKLPYAAQQVGFSAEHEDFVNGLRESIRNIDNIHYLDNARVKQIDDRVLTVKVGGELTTFEADRIVGADGRSSTVREFANAPDNAHLLSHMAGVTFKDASLPFESHGHIFLGGPGPVLLYRIGPDRLRACIDLPKNYPGSRRDATYLWDAFGQVFPEPLRKPFKRALERDKVAWAANRFRPRSFYGSGRISLVGDAVGFFHPMTAAGITTGLLDAEALCKTNSVEEYAQVREPQSYVPELLANALYQVFVRQDDSARAIRGAVYSAWRKSTRERDRTMRILAGEETRLPQFGAAFVSMALGAVKQSVKQEAQAGRFAKIPKRIASFGEWVHWPAATLAPRIARRSFRNAGDPANPFFGWSFAPSNHTEMDFEVPSATDIPAAQVIGLSRSATSKPQDISLGDIAKQKDVQEAQVWVADWIESLAQTNSPARELWLARRLKKVNETFPGLLPAEIRASLEALRVRVIARKNDNGSFGQGCRDTAISVETLVMTNEAAVSPLVRRASAWLVARQCPDGHWEGDSTNEVVSALLATHAAYWDAIERGVAFMITKGESFDEELAERYRLRREDRIKGARHATATEADWLFCQRSLEEVSRTFVRPIEMLPETLRIAVSCGYLLCRVADTIEDNPNLTMEERDARYEAFLEIVEQNESSDRFEGMWTHVKGRKTELELCSSLGRVMRVFRDLPEAMQHKTLRWVAEMTRGMQLYSHRKAGTDGFNALYTVEDLERYCYFVAGTVGHMLTDLFVEEMGVADSPTELMLRENAEAFGVGLQLVNILKDVTDDRERFWSFVPRSACAKEGVAMVDLTDPSLRSSAHAVVAPLFDNAQAKLDRAFKYCLSIPAEHSQMRLFCLLPLWMAVRTLVHGRGNDAMFLADEKVKITRVEVESLIKDCLGSCMDDQLLRERYDRLWRTPADQTNTQHASA